MAKAASFTKKINKSPNSKSSQDDLTLNQKINKVIADIKRLNE